MMTKLQSRLGLWLLFVLTATLAVSGQTSSGTIAGTITDATGAAVSGATVTAISRDTGEKRVVQTNSVGGYRIESVTPGTFSVSAEAPTFQKIEKENIQVNASTITSVNETLSVGTHETVEVAADQVTLATDTGAISGTLSATAVDNLPIQGLNPYFLALTLPGVQSVGNNAFSNGINFSVDGSRSRSNNFLIEGSDNNDAGIHGQGLQPENLDAIEQVAVLENAYQAEFGGGGGSISNLIYKNGSNHFHGSAWDRIENSSLDAGDKSNFFSGGFKSKYRENIFGYDIGGFAVKDKLFFFNSLQFDHYRSSTSSTLIVPTTSGIASLKSLGANPRVTNLLTAISTLQGTDFTPTQVQNGVSGSTNFSCILITETVAPTTFCPGGNAIAVGPATRSIPTDTNAPELDNKVEYIPNQKDTIVFRYIRTSFNAPYDTFNYPSQLPGFDTTQYGDSHNAGITETHIFSANILNDLRLSYGRIGFIFDFQPQTYANPLGTGPTTGIPGITGFGAPSGDPQSRQHNTYQLQDALSWNVHGRHAIKIGFDVLDIRVRDAVPFNFYGSISYAASTGFSGLANYIDDFGGTNGTVAQDFGNPIARPVLWEQNYYVQDTWKAAENLTVELGFRYEYEGAPFNSTTFPAFDIHNTACTNPPTTAGVTAFCNVKETGDGSGYGPRFGFAYTPAFLGKKTVLRGGFGIFYDGLFTNIIDNTQSTSPNAASPEVISNTGGRGLANLSTYFSTLSKTPIASNLLESMIPNIRSPRTLQWNLNVQQDLGHGFISQIGYVGTRGEHLYGTTESNPVIDPFGTGDRLFPALGRVVLRDNSGDSIYHSAQVEINRAFAHGFLMRAAYTWSKFEDDVSEIFTSGNASTYGMLQYPFPRKDIDYGQSALDVRHRLALTYVYAPPAWHPEGKLKFAGNIVNGFQFTGVNIFASGNPGNVEVGYDYNGDGISNDRPALSNPYAPQATYGWDRASYFDGNPGICDGPTLWYYGSCTPVTAQQIHYIVPAEGGQFGTTILQPVIQRNSFRTLGNQEQDLSIQRTFHIHESQNFDFRAEAFNVLNQGTTGTPSLTLTGINPDPATFGANTFADFAPTLSGHRNLRFYVKYRF
jgi:Carboxypeptidase regulatory-like domain